MPKVGEVVAVGWKRCTKCKVVKSVEYYYHTVSKGKKQIYSYCIPCVRSNAKYIRSKYPERSRAYSRSYYSKRGNDCVDYNIRCRMTSNKSKAKKHNYTPCITPIDDIILQYTTRCFVCKKDIGKKIHLDHCHTTGKFRGFLCHGCNSTIGHANDSPELLRKLADYLEGKLDEEHRQKA